MLKLFLVLSNGFDIATETGIGESEVIVTEWNIRDETQGNLELFDRLQGAIRILVGTTEQYMGKRCFRIELDGLFQFSGCIEIVRIRQQHQCNVKVHVG